MCPTAIRKIMMMTIGATTATQMMTMMEDMITL